MVRGDAVIHQSCTRILVEWMAQTLLTFPDPDEELLPGVFWGDPSEPLTPAYWAALSRAATHDDTFHNPAGSLSEEVVFCLLGGYGIKAEINVAAFDLLRLNGIPGEVTLPSHTLLERLLREPLTVSNRKVRYRFPRQRALRIASALASIDQSSVPTEALSLRDWLKGLTGIGPKTASWIVRNHSGTDEVAILDVHIVRACQAINLFPMNARLPRDYQLLEEYFLNFASAIGVRASILDAVMWRQMRYISTL